MFFVNILTELPFIQDTYVAAQFKYYCLGYIIYVSS